MRRGVRAEEENETLLALVLEKLTVSETALLPDAVQLSLTVQASSHAGSKPSARNSDQEEARLV